MKAIKSQEQYLQGDICLVDFNPTLGDEMQKIRPAVIINGNFAVGLDLRIAAPVTTWKPDFDKIWWLVKLNPDIENGLDAVSVVNCYQLRCVSLKRIIKKIGIAGDDLENIVAASQNCIDILP
mgnify:CR=1 FL=1